MSGSLPPVHHCSACDEEHPMGWCRLKLAGVEHCGLCGIAHLGHSRTCPHLNDETQVGRLLQTLKESPEALDHVEAATKYLRMIRGDLVQRKRKKLEQEMNRPTQQVAPVPEQRVDSRYLLQSHPVEYQRVADGLRAMSDGMWHTTVAVQGNHILPSNA